MAITFDVTTVDINPDGLAELAADPELLGVLGEMAQVVGDVATSLAPRHIAPTITILGEDIDQEGAVVYVGSADPFAHLWEFGSVNTDALGYMRGAAMQVGASYEEG